MNKEQYFSEIRNQYHLICVTLKSGQNISILEKGRFEGFLRAGLVIGATTHSEMQQLLEDIHFKVFNKTIAERKKDQKTWFPEDVIDYEQFYRPTFERTPVDR